MHVIGASGTGKSTFLFNLIRQDVESGRGLAVLDPHGDLIDAILGVIPQGRVKDVILLDPADEEYVIGFNILSAHSDLERNLLAADLVSVFRRLSSSWGDQMGSVLQNAIMAFLESATGGTLVDLQRFLIEPRFREDVLRSVRDPAISYYWRKAFPQLGGNRSIGSILTRLEMFLSPKAIRRMVSVKENNLDFGSIMDGGKILLAKLSQGAIGPENPYLLGSLLVAKIHQAAMSRQRQESKERRDFFLYVDECHHFLTASMAEILTDARKYRLGLTLCHQELRQVSRDSDVGSALLANAHTRVVFRVGDEDAREFAKGFSYFDAADISNLGKGEAICRVEKAANDFNLMVRLPTMPSEAERKERWDEVRRASRAAYAVPCAKVEEAWVEAETPKDEEAEKPAPPSVVSEKKPPAAPKKEKPEAVAPAELGRGGVQHKAIQDRIKAEAEALGFRVVVEKQILDGAGSVDLLVERDGEAIACEVSITTTLDHEVGNVSKCLKAGFTDIVLLSVEEEKLEKLKAAVTNSLGAEKAAAVRFLLPDEFISALKAMKPKEVVPEEPPPRGGRRVKRSYVPLSPEEAKLREEQALRLMAEMMKKKR